MMSCNLAFLVLFSVLLSSPVFATSWDSLGFTTSTSGNSYPGARYGAATWTSNGAHWMFSGAGNEGTKTEGLLSSLYKYDPATNKWSLEAGSTIPNQVAVFPENLGGKGFPGGRTGAARWTDLDGNLWVFGGQGLGDSSTQGLLNDMWKYNVAKNEWTYYGGNKQAGKATSDEQRPTPRAGACYWVDVKGNLWMYGGKGMTAGASTAASMLTDMWHYSPSQSEWTSFPTGDVFPAGRTDAACWTDASGNGWIYGGRDAQSNLFADMWTFQVSDLSWTQKTTTTKNSIPSYPSATPGAGTPGGLHSAGAFSFDNSLYLFGGFGLDNIGAQGANRDLWMFNTLSNTWSYIFGTGSTSARVGSSSQLGARASAAVFGTPAGGMLVFGGIGYDTTGSSSAGIIGDTWNVAVCQLDGTCSKDHQKRQTSQTSTTASVAASTTKAPTTSGASLTSGSTTGAKATTTGAKVSSTGNVTTTGAATTGGSTTGETPVETTTSANVTVTISGTTGPDGTVSLNISALALTVANGTGVSEEFIVITIEYDDRKRVVRTFRIIITIIFPNSSAIQAVVGGETSANMTSSLGELASIVTAAANGTAVRNLFAAANLTVTGVETAVESEIVVVPTTGPNFPQTTGGYNAATTLSPSFLTLALSLLLLFAPSVLWQDNNSNKNALMDL